MQKEKIVIQSAWKNIDMKQRTGMSKSFYKLSYIQELDTQAVQDQHIFTLDL